MRAVFVCSHFTPTLSYLQPLANHCLQALNQHPSKRLFVGFSGGRDSHVLLDLLVTLRQQQQLSSDIIAIHVNHQLQPNANDWVRHCRTVCDDLGVPLREETVIQQPAKGESIEAFARNARYRLIKPHIQRGDSFLSAHHCRDQAETFLLQLMRGAGLDGLQAMPVAKSFGAGQYLRPLLGCDYQDIVNYAAHAQLSFIDDASNNDTRFDRNFIRHRVLPVLRERFPHADNAISRSASWLAEVPEAPVPECLSLPTLSSLSAQQQKQCIRAFVKHKTGTAMSHTQTQYVLNHHLTAAADKHPALNVGGKVLRRWQGELVVTDVLPDFTRNFLWRDNVGVGEVQLFSDFATLDWEGEQGGLLVGTYHLRPLDGRARFHPHTRAHSTTVKRILHEHSIAPWLRNALPGLYDGQTLVAIPNIGVAMSHYQKSENAVMPMWIINQKFVRL